MLSYQHHFHAGNAADVHKHALLSVMLAYMTQKDKPLSYLETHAGRGVYDLGAEHARKTAEADAGIVRAEARGWFAPDHPYAQVLARARSLWGTRAYPGSPAIAGLMLRAGDKINLAELHPAEVDVLGDVMAGFGAHIHAQDGFAMARALTPPMPRRGVLLVDPSYEVKSDYETLPDFLRGIHRKWNVGVLALWYPLLESGAHKSMLAALDAAELPGALRHEVLFGPARPGHRMVGSELFIVNAPYGLEQEAKRLGRLFAKG